jgi:hypothetical protein
MVFLQLSEDIVCRLASGPPELASGWFAGTLSLDFEQLCGCRNRFQENAAVFYRDD